MLQKPHEMTAKARKAMTKIVEFREKGRNRAFYFCPATEKIFADMGDGRFIAYGYAVAFAPPCMSPKQEFKAEASRRLVMWCTSWAAQKEIEAKRHAQHND